MIKNILLGLIESILRNISGPVGRKIRYLYYKRRLGSCGSNVMIDEGVIFINPKSIFIKDNVWIDMYTIMLAGTSNSLNQDNCKKKINKEYLYEDGELHIGNNVHIAPYCLLQAHAGIEIQDNCALAAGTKMYSLSNLPSYPHDKSKVINFSPLVPSFYIHSPIVLEENVGIGLNGIVLFGVTIRKDSFIAPNSVVMTSIKRNSFAEGNPAKRIKDRFDLEVQK